MIVKKVPTSKLVAPKSKALNVRALADHIAGPNAGGDGEKVEHRGFLNLLNVDHDAQVDEMIDLAETALRSPHPVQHWIISWREGEQPTAARADAAVATFVDEMGLAEHQVIYALHLAKCRDCGWSRPVAFSCRRRGFCPSCIGRRMSDFAAPLVDRVIPRVPVRQWVLTVPHALRAKMMFDPALTSAVLRELIRAVSSWLRQRAPSDLASIARVRGSARLDRFAQNGMSSPAATGLGLRARTSASARWPFWPSATFSPFKFDVLMLPQAENRAGCARRQDFACCPLSFHCGGSRVQTAMILPRLGGRFRYAA